MTGMIFLIILGALVIALALPLKERDVLEDMDASMREELKAIFYAQGYNDNDIRAALRGENVKTKKAHAQNRQGNRPVQRKTAHA